MQDEPEQYDEFIPPISQLYDTNNKLTAQNTTALQLLNSILTNATTLHRIIKRDKKNKDRIKIKQMHAKINALLKRKKHAKPDDQVVIQQNLRDHQQAISSIQENRDTVSEMRIENFYKTNIGKNVPITYKIAKERHSDRYIRTLNHLEQQYTEPQDIQRIMVDHYQNTANVVNQQMTTLESFLQQYSVPPLPT